MMQSHRQSEFSANSVSRVRPGLGGLVHLETLIWQNLTPAERVTWGPHLHVNRPLVSLEWQESVIETWGIKFPRNNLYVLPMHLVGQRPIISLYWLQIQVPQSFLLFPLINASIPKKQDVYQKQNTCSSKQEVRTSGVFTIYARWNFLVFLSSKIIQNSKGQKWWTY